MDSPGPRAKASNLASRQAPREQTPAEADSPCVVDKLLNFSPSKYSEVYRDQNDNSRWNSAQFGFAPLTFQISFFFISNFALYFITLMTPPKSFRGCSGNAIHMSRNFLMSEFRKLTWNSKT